MTESTGAAKLLAAKIEATIEVIMNETMLLGRKFVWLRKFEK